jgi:NADPH:quinone reductase-like Zn-dependent oxidoreductase
VTFFIAKFNKRSATDLVESGKVRSVIDSRFPLDAIAAALTHQGEGHPDGEVVVDVRTG